MSNQVFTCICGRESCQLKRFALNQTDRNCGMVYMEQRKRLYATILRDHLKDFRQMAFITGPRQVGKTTTCRGLCDAYLNWDNEDHREIILRGPAAVAAHAGLDVIAERPTLIVFDELHKYRRWKLFLKGLFEAGCLPQRRRQSHGPIFPLPHASIQRG